MNNDEYGLRSTLTSALEAVRRGCEIHEAEIILNEVGEVISVLTGVAIVSGLPNVGSEELVSFEKGMLGLAYDLAEEHVGVILLSESRFLNAGSEVTRTRRVVDIPVGEGLLGRVIDPQGDPLDGKGALQCSQRMGIEQESPGIVDRLPVAKPLQTGIKVIDALIPVGHGQRELILGDRQTGKSAIAIDAIINQKGKDVICVYCAIGQRSSSVAKAIADLHEAMPYTVVMVAEGDKAPGLRYIAPYAATTIAEYFMRQGRQVLIVYDDLTAHARSYRELSLLLRRPPGREAFPGDIFYIHARLLERATHLREEMGGGSLTALPIVETQAQDVSAYIPTNLISITDGQIILSSDLFEKGVLPAVDVGKSVSRVGGKAQLPAYREVAGSLKLSYSQFEELEAFARFGTQLDKETRDILNHGRKVRWCLNQNRLSPLDVVDQIFMLLAYTEGLLDNVPIERLTKADERLMQASGSIPDSVRRQIHVGEKMTAQIKSNLLNLAKEFLSDLHEAAS